MTMQPIAHCLHRPVLLREVVEALKIDPDGIYIDCTFGRGGHSCEILKNLSGRGRLLVLDQDPQAVAHAKILLADDCRVSIESDNFSRVAQIAEKYGFGGKVKGILFDLGVSSPQLDDPVRGFSFVQDGPLDMRMNTNEGITAADWLQQVNFRDLEEVLRVFGEERYSKKVASAILARQKIRPLETTRQLAEVVLGAVGRSSEKKHPATRTFQAIRIFINQELKALEAALDSSVKLLTDFGRMLIITFHSREDQVVKAVFRKHSKFDVPRKLPVADQPLPDLKRACKPVHPSTDEVIFNARARSAKLHVLERVTC